ncbi:hypothetical protein ACFQ60_01060 [Streptomyces zhihengii]
MTQLLRALAGMGLLEEHEPDTFSMTPTGALLDSGRPNSLTAFVRMLTDPAIVAAWDSLDGSVRTGRIANSARDDEGPGGRSCKAGGWSSCAGLNAERNRTTARAGVGTTSGRRTRRSPGRHRACRADADVAVVGGAARRLAQTEHRIQGDQCRPLRRSAARRGAGADRRDGVE